MVLQGARSKPWTPLHRRPANVSVVSRMPLMRIMGYAHICYALCATFAYATLSTGLLDRSDFSTSGTTQDDIAVLTERRLTFIVADAGNPSNISEWFVPSSIFSCVVLRGLLGCLLSVATVNGQTQRSTILWVVMPVVQTGARIHSQLRLH